MRYFLLRNSVTCSCNTCEECDNITAPYYPISGFKTKEHFKLRNLVFLKTCRWQEVRAATLGSAPLKLKFSLAVKLRGHKPCLFIACENSVPKRATRTGGEEGGLLSRNTFFISFSLSSWILMCIESDLLSLAYHNRSSGRSLLIIPQSKSTKSHWTQSFTKGLWSGVFFIS